MTTDEMAADFEDDVDAPVRACARCGHADAEHVLRDAEEAGATVRAVICVPCSDWHDFVPDPRDL